MLVSRIKLPFRTKAELFSENLIIIPDEQGKKKVHWETLNASCFTICLRLRTLGNQEILETSQNWVKT